MKFKDRMIKPGMVIHCPTEEDARALLEYLKELGYTWFNGNLPTDITPSKRYNCYHICEGKIIYRDSYDFYVGEKYQITEFPDLLEPETLSGKEVIERFDKYSREIESMSEVFPNCKTIADVVENYTPECIMEKMTWYEKHKKDKGGFAH